MKKNYKKVHTFLKEKKKAAEIMPKKIVVEAGGKRERKEIILPLYFGWEIVIRRIKDWQSHIVGPFKKYWHYMTVVATLIFIISALIFINKETPTRAATKTFMQTNWNSLTANSATNTLNQSGWTEYSATSTDIIASSSVMMSGTASSTIKTSTADFSDGTTSQTAVSNNSVALDISATNWTSTVIDAGSVNSLALGSDGFARIGYKSDLNALKFVQCTNISCSTKNISTPVATTNIGDPSLALGSDGFARISYQDSSNGDLKFFRCTNASCSAGSNTNVDSTGNVGFNTSLALGSDGFARISYYDGSNANLKFVQCTNANCSTNNITTVDSTGNVGSDTSLALGSDGFARISYYDGTNANLKFVQCTNADCSTNNITTIDSTGNVGQDTSLTLGSDGFARISYYDATNRDLKFVQCTNADCSTKNITTVDSTNDVGYYTSLKLGSDGFARISYYDGTNANLKFVYAYSTYYSSGTYTSSSFSPNRPISSWGTLSWTASGTGTITMKARTDADGDFSNATDWASCSNITSGAAISTGGCSSNSHRFIQYQAALSTADTSVTPSLDDVTIGYNYYPEAGQSLTSSAYNTEGTLNIMAGISWTENSTLPEGTYVALALKATSSQALLSATDWPADFTSTSTNCSKIATSTVTCTAASIPAGMKDQSGDQWFQYKIMLSSTGSSTPQVTDVTVTYAVNDSPELQNVAAAQQSDGTVLISYETRDPDTGAESANPGLVTPSFQYSTNSGTSWTDITSNLSSSATSTKAVGQVAWSSYSATWTAKNVLDGTYSTTFQIKVKVDDSEAANNIASSSTGNIALDVKDPVPGATPLIIQATTTPASLILSASDDSSLQMKIGLASNLSDGAWIAYSSASSTSLATDPDIVYVQFKDAYANTSSIVSATSIETPTGMMAQDVSDQATNEWRLFTAWKVSSINLFDFASYRLYRSTDGGSAYSLLTTITNRATNYYIDPGLTASSTYYYKVSAMDNSGNGSYFSPAIQAIANAAEDAGEGGGGSPESDPVISSISSSGITTESATITWTTDKLSNSTVGYCLSPCSDYSTEQAVSSYVLSHSVILTDLTPNTAYNYKVISTDIYSNIASTTGNSFTTNAGPTISNVAIIDVSNTSSQITWNTNASATGYVVYGTSTPPSANTTGTTTSSVSRTISLTGLSSATKYYFYVKSQDSSDNWAYDYNDVDGVREYYSFSTASDSSAPTISSISASPVSDTTAVITWTTNEKATSQVEYGTSSGVYNTFSALSNSLNLGHSVTLSGLSYAQRYYFRVASADAGGNLASSTEQTFITLEKLSQESQVVNRETTARSGGGGILFVDKTDKTSPIISEIKISDVKSDSAVINWLTNEEASSFVEYGADANFGSSFGKYALTKEHVAVLSNLQPGINYSFKAASADSYGNLAISDIKTFSTLSELEELVQEEAQALEEIKAPTGEKPENLLSSVLGKAMEIISKVASQVSLGALESALKSQYSSIENLAKIIPAPIFSGEPKVITTATTATIIWGTDKEANGLVAISSEKEYNPSSSNPYIQVVGNSEEKSTNHQVTISDLEPDTVYHYQLRSKAVIGSINRSKDFSFKTKTELLEITNYSVEKTSSENAIFKWTTNIEADSQVKYTPYRNNILAVDESSSVFNKATTATHEINVKDFESGVIYEVGLISRDIQGNMASEIINAFSTSEEDLPPMISQVQTDSALSPGKELKVQTIISWLTNEPATSRVFYQKGFADSEKLTEETKLDKNYTKKHMAVITKFEPGSIYRFKVESVDSSGNKATSKTYTILTPRQQESVFQIIMKNFEEIFGWMSVINK